MPRRLSWLALVVAVTGTACKKDYDYTDGNGPPVITISSPTAGEVLCSSVEAAFTATGSRDGLAFTCAIDDGPAAPCTSPLTTFDLVAPGAHTLTVSARNDVGDGEPVTVAFEVDGAAPIVDLTPFPRAINTGAGEVTVAILNDEASISIDAGLELTVGDGQPRVVVPASCACTERTCECTGLAAGENWIAVDVTDACGNVSRNATNVTATFGPYRGHAVLIGHDYRDEATPDVVGNAAALAPFIADGLDIGRTSARVVAWRPAGVTDEVASHATDAISRVLTEAGIDFDVTSTTDYVELSDPALLDEILPGRDVLLLHEPAAAYDDAQLDAIADGWAARLAAFTSAGGVVIALHGDHGWRLLAGGDAPLIAVTGGRALDAGVEGGLSPNFIRSRYPASVLGTAGYPLLDGAEDTYVTPAGSGCVDIDDPSATVVADHIGGVCNDGCFYNACDAIVDQRLPRFTIAVSPGHDVDPYPACVPDGVGLASDGSFTIELGDGQPAPTGTFVCTYAPQPGYLQSPAPTRACTVTAQDDGSYALDMASAPRNGWTHVDITLVDNGVPVRSGRATVYVDALIFVNSGNVAANACSAGFVVREYRPPLDSACGATVPTYLPVQSVSCTLERETAPGVWTRIGNRTGVGCGVTASPGGGFLSNDYVVNWSSDIVNAGASGNLRYTISATDYHGNVDSSGRSWTLSSPSVCGG